MKIVFNHIEDVVSIHNIGLYSKLHSLGYACCVSDMIVWDNHNLIKQHLIDNGTLSIFKLAPKEMLEISKLFYVHSTSVSFKDIAICYYAKQQDATVVSNEKSVIEIAKTLEVKYTSTIALINSLLIKNMEYVIK